MCGIVGYVGKQQAAPLLLDGLCRLEYRGYDSAGVAVCGAGGLQVRKTPGASQGAGGADPRRRRSDGHRGHRPHPLGHPRRAQRASTPTRRSAATGSSPWCITALSRTTPELKQELIRKGVHLCVGNGHRGGGAAAGVQLPPVRRHVRGGEPDALAAGGLLCAGHRLRRHAGSRHRRPEGQRRCCWATDRERISSPPT